MHYLRIYNTVDSTNLEARRLLTTGALADGTTLLALDQTEGKGQYGRTWTAQPGLHLAMTLIHIPTAMPVSDLPTMSMKVCLGILQALQQIAPDVPFQIKWPNDIYTSHHKLAGILIENTLSGQYVQQAIIGIGMNINESSFSPDLPNPVSLGLLTGKSYDLAEIAGKLREEILIQLHSDLPVRQEVFAPFLYGLDETHTFIRNGQQIRAVVKGVTVDGLLRLQLDPGMCVAFASHEIRWVLPNPPASGSDDSF